MQHRSHQTLNSGSFIAFIVAPDLALHLDSSDIWISLPGCSQPDGGIVVPGRSERACAGWTAQLHLHFDRVRKGLVYDIFDRTHRDTAAYRSWTIVECT